MTEQSVNVSKVAWRDLFPWTIIFKTLPIAASVAVMAWATVGVVLTPMGWIVSETVFISEDVRAENPGLSEIAKLNRSPYRALFRSTRQSESAIEVLGASLSGPRLVFENTIKPYQALFRSGWSAKEYFYLLSGCLWALIVWSFVGCAITRICVLRLTRDEPLSIDDAFDFAVDKFKDCFGALAMPFVGIAFLCIPCAFFGILLGFNIGTFIAGLFWFIVLILAAIMAFLLLGIMFGWPLIVASVSAEGQNAFDALTRAFAYTFQRPLNYALYMLIATLFGGFCWLIVSTLTDGIIETSYWATSWGANRFNVEGYEPGTVTRIDMIEEKFDPRGPIETGKPAAEGVLPELDSEVANQYVVPASLENGRKIIGFWNGFARTLAAAFIHGLFWCMAGAVYLLMRWDVDETEMDEVYLVDERRTYDLPPLKSDENGIPQVQEPQPVPDESAPSEPTPSDEA